MRTIRQIHPAVYEPIADLATYRALPTHSIQYIDPFLFLNHHGPQVYPPSSSGLPFGPHPHRGFETVTIVLDGDIEHRDSGGNSGVIFPGGVQWMTAGSGLIHSEVSSEGFKESGGKLEILQLWLNLPAKHKRIAPGYKDLQKHVIPVHTSSDRKVRTAVIAGKWEDVKGAYEPLTDVELFTITADFGAHFQMDIPVDRNIFFYVIEGNVIVNGVAAPQFRLVEFENDANGIAVEATIDSKILLGHAVPFNEPVVAQGPFVMNTQEEIDQAYRDYQAGKFGEFR